MALRDLILAAGALAFGVASADAQLVPYDDFSSKRIDSAKWRGVIVGSPLEIVRQVQRGALLMHVSDQPGEGVHQNLEFAKRGADVNRLTTVQVNLTVHSVTGTWAGNVGLDGAWYCSGTCTPGPPPAAFVDTVFVQLFIGACGGCEGGLNVNYSVRKYVTGGPDDPILSGVLATNVKFGVPHVLRVTLDPSSKDLTFTFDGLRFTPLLPPELRWSGDATGFPYKQLGMSGFTVVPSEPGDVTVSFDRVLVNPEY